MRPFVLVIALASVTAAAAGERTFPFPHLTSPPDFDDAAKIMASLTAPAEVTFDPSQLTVTVRGSADDLALAGWLAERLDSGMPDGGVQQARAGDDVVELVSLRFADPGRGFLEAATVIRSIGEIRTLSTAKFGRIVALRGSPAQADLAQWLAGEFARAAAGNPSPATKQFTDFNSSDDTVAVLYLKSAADDASFQQAAVQIRSSTGIRRFFTYNGPRAFIVRSTADQVARAGDMVNARN